MSISSLKERFVRAAGWTLFGHLLAQVVRFGSNLILTRLLAPDLYGVMAVGYVVMAGIALFSDIGLNSGAIRSRRGEEPLFLNVGWVVQIARGGLIMIAALAVAGGLHVAAAAGWLAAHSVYADPRVPLVIALVSIDGIISGLESTKAWVARRHLKMATLTKLDLASQFASTTLILTWAFLSPTLWALVGGWLFGAAVRTTLTHLLLPGPHNRIEWDRSAFREIWHFGKWVFVSSSFTFLLSNGDRLLLAGMLDSKTNGLYAVAMLLVGAVKVAVARVMGDAVLPALSEVFRSQGAPALREKIYRVRWPMDALCVISAGALFMLGEPIIRILYDQRYVSAGWMLSVLSLTLIPVRMDVFDQCLIVIGRVKLLSVLNAVRLVALYGAVIAGYASFGVSGAVAGVAVSALANTVAVLGFQARLGLLDFKRELLVVPLFGAGLALGWLVSLPLHAVR